MRHISLMDIKIIRVTMKFLIIWEILFIAKEINALNDIERVENEKGIKNFIHAIFSVMGLSIVNFIIILSSIFIFSYYYQLY